MLRVNELSPRFIALMSLFTVFSVLLLSGCNADSEADNGESNSIYASDEDLVKCITALAWIANKHQHRFTANTLYSGGYTYGPYPSRHSDLRVSQLINENCRDVLDGSLITQLDSDIP